MGLDATAVQKIGATHLRDPAPIAHAICSAAHILDLGLDFEPDNIPERHANIVGWPMRKEEQKLIALKLVAAATVVRYQGARC